MRPADINLLWSAVGALIDEEDEQAKALAILLAKHLTLRKHHTVEAALLPMSSVGDFVFKRFGRDPKTKLLNASTNLHDWAATILMGVSLKRLPNTVGEIKRDLEFLFEQGISLAPSRHPRIPEAMRRVRTWAFDDQEPPADPFAPAPVAQPEPTAVPTEPIPSGCPGCVRPGVHTADCPNTLPY